MAPYVPRLRLQPAGRLRRQQVVRRRSARPRQGRARDGQLGRGLRSPWRSRPARDCLTGARARRRAQPLPRLDHACPFKDRQNAGVIGTALDRRATASRPSTSRGSQRAGTSALIAGLNAAKDGRGRPGRRRRQAHDARRPARGADYGDAAAAMLVRHRQGDRQARRPSSASIDFVDHFRGDGERFRLPLGRALDPRRGLLRRSCRRRSRRRSPAAGSGQPTSTISSCRA